jgi:hypothetical protein
MRGDPVPESVYRYSFAEGGSGTGRATGGMQGRRGQRLVRLAAGKQPLARLHEPPIAAQKPLQ